MQRGVSSCPKWHSALWALLLPALLSVSEAGITCRSCQPGSKWRGQELLLRLGTGGPAAGPLGEVLGDGAPRPCDAVSAGCARDYAESRPERSNPRAGEAAQAKVSRARRDTEVRDREPRERTRVPRSELRWSGEERRAAGARPEEPRVNSSTFALSGDSSHNQAMVHWSGQNSSVSPPACPFLNVRVRVCV